MADLTVLAVLLLLLVTGGAAQWLVRDLRRVPRGDEPAEDLAAVSVVIPARDEEATLPALLASLAPYAGRLRDLVVVDDASTDATAAVARSAGARVVTVAEPPPGWTGKAWACQVGVRASTGEVLLFLDADTVLAPGALEGLLDLHARHGGLVSVQPFHRVPRAYEQLSAYFNVVSVVASGAFRRRPRGRPLAFGPCLLTTRADHERAGGHAAVRAEILDDVSLAAAYHRAGLPVHCAVGADAIGMRSYPGGLGQLVSGWSKNFASGASATPAVPLLATVAWIGAQHAVAVGTLLTTVSVTAGWAPLAAGPGAVWVVGWAGFAWQLRWLLRRLGSFRWWTWAVFPVPLLAFDVIFAISVVHTAARRSVRWRGREVSVSRRRSAREGA